MANRRGTSGRDTLAGASGDDILRGQAGADTLDPRGGSDIVHAGRGQDRIFWRAGPDRIDGGPGTDTLDLRHFDDFVSLGRLSRETSLDAEDFANAMLMTLGMWVQTLPPPEDEANPLPAEWGVLVQHETGLYKLRSFEQVVDPVRPGLLGEENPLTGVAEQGSQRTVVARNIERITGSEGDDFFMLGGGLLHVNHNTLDNVTSLPGALGLDRIEGGAGNDVIGATFMESTTTRGDGLVLGGPGNDHISVNGARVDVRAGEGRDQVDAGFISASSMTRFRVDGGGGDDAPLWLDDWLEFVDTGDTAGLEAVNVLTTTGGGLYGSGRGDEITGGRGRDFIVGFGGADKLGGGRGNDVIVADSWLNYQDAEVFQGGTSADTLRGGRGDDWLMAAAGGDILEGGPGSDVFVLPETFGWDIASDPLTGRPDRGQHAVIIRDFDPGEDEVHLKEAYMLDGRGVPMQWSFIDREDLQFRRNGQDAELWFDDFIDEFRVATFRDTALSGISLDDIVFA